MRMFTYVNFYICDDMNPCIFFKCLADDVRLKLLLLVSEAGEVCVCDLVSALNIDQPKTSRNLAKLRECKIIIGERRGKWIFYKLHPDLPSWARNVIQETANKNHKYLGSALTKLTCCGLKIAQNC